MSLKTMKKNFGSNLVFIYWMITNQIWAVSRKKKKSSFLCCTYANNQISTTSYYRCEIKKSSCSWYVGRLFHWRRTAAESFKLQRPTSATSGCKTDSWSWNRSFQCFNQTIQLNMKVYFLYKRMFAIQGQLVSAMISSPSVILIKEKK